MTLRRVGLTVRYQSLHNDNQSVNSAMLEAAYQSAIQSPALSSLRQLVNMIQSPISLEVYNFGHMGDDNLHLNILLRPQEVRTREAHALGVEHSLHRLLDDIVYPAVAACEGLWTFLF